jgi:hypothetical protein
MLASFKGTVTKFLQTILYFFLQELCWDFQIFWI